jgi:hypothetical protein
MISASLRVFAAAMAICAASCRPSLAPPDGPPLAPRGEGPERVRDLLFADQDLADLFRGSRLPPAEDAALRKIDEGDPRTAEALLVEPAQQASSASRLLLLARARLLLSDKAGARRALEEVLRLPSSESRNRLWACNALRTQGAQIDPILRDEVLGIVAETPIEGGLDSLATYRDGGARYVNRSGALIFYDPHDGRLKAQVSEVLSTATLLLPAVKPGEPRGQLGPDSFRFTLLTCGGPRVAIVDRTTLGTGTAFDPLFAASARLLQALAGLRARADGGSH